MGDVTVVGSGTFIGSGVHENISPNRIHADIRDLRGCQGDLAHQRRINEQASLFAFSPPKMATLAKFSSGADGELPAPAVYTVIRGYHGPGTGWSHPQGSLIDVRFEIYRRFHRPLASVGSAAEPRRAPKDTGDA